MTSLHADEAFLTHYQFSHDPFAPRVPGFKFFPAQRKPVLGQLHHLARYSQLLLAVVGPEGSGKTLLRQALVASTNKQAVQSVVVGQGVTDSQALLGQVAQGLSIAQANIFRSKASTRLAITGAPSPCLRLSGRPAATVSSRASTSRRVMEAAARRPQAGTT